MPDVLLMRHGNVLKVSEPAGLKIQISEPLQLESASPYRPHVEFQDLTVKRWYLKCHLYHLNTEWGNTIIINNIIKLPLLFKIFKNIES